MEACSNTSMAFSEGVQVQSLEKAKNQGNITLTDTNHYVSESSQALVIKYFATMTLIGQAADVVARVCCFGRVEEGRRMPIL